MSTKGDLDLDFTGHLRPNVKVILSSCTSQIIEQVLSIKTLTTLTKKVTHFNKRACSFIWVLMYLVEY